MIFGTFEKGDTDRNQNSAFTNSNSFRNQKSMFENVITVFCIIVTVWMVTTFVHATAYSVLSADDFGHAAGLGIKNACLSEAFSESIKYSIDRYMNWQGTYFSMFLQILLSPVNNGWLPQLRWVMTLNSLSFLSAVILIVNCFVRKIDKDRNYIRATIVMLVCYLVVGYESYHEVFFWYSGAVSYSIPMTLLIVAFFFFFSKEGNIALGCTLILGILAMGGTLAVAGWGCYCAVISCLYDHWVVGCLNKKHLVVTIVWIVFAMINAMAPGNYVRHNVIDSTGIHPINALYFSVEMVDSRWKNFFINTDFVFVIMLLLICGIVIGNYNQQIKRKVVIGVMLLLGPIVAAFPMALGYSGMSVENRGAFVIDMAIICSSLYITIVCGALIRGVFENDIKKIIVIVGIIASACFMLDGYGISDLNIRTMSYMLSSGVYKDHYRVTEEFYKKLESCEKGYCVWIPFSEIPYMIKNLQNFCITDDPNNNMNKDVARWYGFESIAYYNEEQ